MKINVTYYPSEHQLGTIDGVTYTIRPTVQEVDPYYDA